MIRHIAATIATVLVCMSVPAQNAEAIISGLIGKIEKDGVKCEATIHSISNMDGDGAKATLKMKGERYCMTTPESSYWYDGKTLWYGITLDGDIIETYISYTTSEGAALSNPFLMMKHHEGFDISAPDSKTIELTAKDRKNGSYGIKEMTVILDNGGFPSEIRLRMNTDDGFIIRIDRYAIGGIDDTDFTYPAAKWPDAEIIDLRL